MTEVGLGANKESRESSKEQEVRVIQEWKRRKDEEQWKSAPSKAPLHSQESCVLS